MVWRMASRMSSVRNARRVWHGRKCDVIDVFAVRWLGEIWVMVVNRVRQGRVSFNATTHTSQDLIIGSGVLSSSIIVTRIILSGLQRWFAWTHRLILQEFKCLCTESGFDTFKSRDEEQRIIFLYLSIEMWNKISCVGILWIIHVTCSFCSFIVESLFVHPQQKKQTFASCFCDQLSSYKLWSARNIWCSFGTNSTCWHELFVCVDATQILREFNKTPLVQFHKKPLLLLRFSAS